LAIIALDHQGVENMSEEAATPKRGVGTVVKERLLAGDTNEQALAAAKAEFPDSATSASTVSWYRNQLRKNGNPNGVLTAAEARKNQAADAAPSEADPLD
jgi:hypothetical protein